MIYFKELDTPEITTKERNQLLFRASQTKDSCEKYSYIMSSLHRSINYRSNHHNQPNICRFLVKKRLSPQLIASSSTTLKGFLD
jgi:hypothetical protein